jgi:hypothetical protein
MLDPQGRNPKERPCVVVACDDAGLVVVGITSTLGDIPDADRVDLPHSNDPRRPCHTGLTRPSAAHCRWLAEVEEAQIVRDMGHVSKDQLRRIQERVQQIQAEGEGQTP